MILNDNLKAPILGTFSANVANDSYRGAEPACYENIKSLLHQCACKGVEISITAITANPVDGNLS